MQNNETMKAIQLFLAVFCSHFGSGVVSSCKASDQGSKAAVRGLVHACTICWKQVLSQEQKHAPKLTCSCYKWMQTSTGLTELFRTRQAQRVSKLPQKKSSSAAIYHEKWLMRPAHWQTAWLPAVVRFLTLLKTEVCQWTQCHKKCRKQRLPSDVPVKPLPRPTRYTQCCGQHFRQLGSLCGG